MKRKNSVFLRLSCLSAASILLFLSCSCGGNAETGTDTPGESATWETKPATEPVTEQETETYLADLTEYLAYLDPPGGRMTLVNKQHPADSTAPEGLVSIDADFACGITYLTLDETATMALCAMLTEMRAAGIDGAYVTSAYRSYAKQQTLFDRYCEEEATAHPTWSEDEVRAQVLTYSAYPGTSEHQTGLCVDLITTAMGGNLYNYGAEYSDSPTAVGFAETDAYAWLCDNAHRFGYILRYPEGKEAVTGYSYESWHYRFVGKTAAEEIHRRGITLEEYLGI